MGRLLVDFSGVQARPAIDKAFEIEKGASAWAVLQQVAGSGNLQYTDAGGGLGVYVTGLYGVAAEGKGYWEFLINGRSSEVGVSQYVVQPGDELQFRYTKP